MLWLWLWLAVSRGGRDYPPPGVTLLQNSRFVPLRWRLRGPVQLQVWQDSREIANRSLRESMAWVEIERGVPVRWRVSNARGESFESEFSLCRSTEYHLDGAAGRASADGYRGLGGGSGGRLRALLSRDDAGMHLILWRPDGRDHYFFSEVGLRFALTVQGGAGAAGADGQNADEKHLRPTPGRDGTSGGNGGHIIISTGTAPWRDYLKVDVSAGRGGKGGRGGAFAHYKDVLEKYGDRDLREADGKDGADGFPGKIETVIQDGW